jgi:hypothetical protein
MRNGLRSAYSHPYRVFRQAVRKYRPSQLLPVVAGIAAQHSELTGRQLLAARPWAQAAIAREAILYGNEHRSGEASVEDVRDLLRSFDQTYEPGLGADPVRNSANAILHRLAYEQFPYQESIYEEICRSQVLLVDGSREIETQVIHQSGLESLLGTRLDLAVGATFLLWVGAQRNFGRYNPSWLDQPNFAEILDTYPRPAVEAVAGRLSATFGEFKADYHRQPPIASSLERFAYNPLSRTPFVHLPDGQIVAPQPKLILRSITPGGLFYAGLEHYGIKFANDLGALVEHYVGKQLAQLEPEFLSPEITYRPPERKSVDWIVVLPGLILLVEVKSGRPTLGVRTGDIGLVEHLQDRLGRAMSQIGRTADCLLAGRAEFSEIPADRPMIGLIVTAEPYYYANSHLVRERIGSTSVPTLTASLRELELLVTLDPADAEERLKAIVASSDLSAWTLGAALGKGPTLRNPILDAAWDAYPWPDEDELAG